MPAPRLLPPDQELARLVDSGLTHQQIADHVYETTGVKVKRAAVSAALHRAGLTKSEGNRYKETIPWRVKQEHLGDYPLRMLRLLGRRRNGQDLTDDESQRLDSWMNRLRAENAVVAYSPIAGVLYVEANEVGDWNDDIPIRRRTIEERELV